ncbi:MAG: hypothetical protein MR508_00565 [Lachnospiraceae bacterium]|nr:hypothetical protein [Lachnospiraceae bacterium]
MVDTKDYARRTSSKLSLYIEDGFTISNDLIITSETKTDPLTPMSIEKTIQHHFFHATAHATAHGIPVYGKIYC